MEGFTKLMCIFFFLALMSPGTLQQCSLSSLSITTKATGKTVSSTPEWMVTVSNNCNCFHKQVELSCNGFQSVEPVPTSVLSKSGDLCLLDDGNAIVGFTSFSFTYASATQFPFKIASSEIACS